MHGSLPASFAGSIFATPGARGFGINHLVVVYGRNPVREALRGRRTVSGVWASEGAAREPWLRDVDVARTGDAEIERRCGSADHQGVCAEVSEFEYADA